MKKVHKRISPYKHGRNIPQVECVTENKTWAFNYTLDDKKVTCARCRRKIKSKMTFK